MSRRSRWVCSTASMPLLIVLFVLGCGKNPNPATGILNEAASVVETDPSFIVPEGKPAEILAFMRELVSRRPEFSNPQERFEYAVKTQRAIIRACDRIIAQQSDDETLKEAVTKKLIGTIGLAANDAGDSVENALAEVNRLRGDKRPIVVEVANQFWIAARSLNIKVLSVAERKQLTEEALQRVADSESSPEAIGDATFLADQFAKVNESESAASIYDRLADSLASSTNDQKTRAIAAKLRSRAARLRIPGSRLELDGKLLSGDDFDWESYRGKVVLVDFWATWCGPCLGELPNVRANYNKYHERGFDVVGISLDNDRRALEKLVQKEAFPWKQLFDDSPGMGTGWQHPIAVRYGVTSIPAAFLVDKEGKVVSTEARGQELDRLLKQLLGTTN